MNIAQDPTIGSQGIDVSDDQLLNHYARSRNPEPFIELVRRYTGLVYGTCKRITANTHDAEELTQECFFDLARQSSEIRLSLVGWLHQVATHRALNRLRGDRRRQTHEQQANSQKDSVSSIESSSDDLSWNRIGPLVDQALAELPEAIRLPLLMTYLEGRTQAEVANRLGLHQSTVSRRLTQGVESLRESLRRAGVVIPLTALVSWFASQSAMAAPPSLGPALGKIGLAGIGTTTAATAGGQSLTGWLAGATKSLFAMLFVPVVSGVLWGQIVFLVVMITWGLYLAWRQPEWVRVLCYTRQFPNIYEWPFFPFTRWTWEKPPREWQIWMTANFVIGMELLGLIAFPFDGTNRFGLVLWAAAIWHFFMAVRIWRRVRHCQFELTNGAALTEFPVDGALLLTYALAGVVLIAKLAASPWFLAEPDQGTGLFRLNVWCVILWGTVLIWGTLLVHRRFRRWREQPLVDPNVRNCINDLMPPNWTLGFLMAIPLVVSLFVTYLALMQDVIPLYVPLGDDANSAAKRKMLSLTLLAMDMIVLASLPLSYLYRRIPRIAWSVAFGVVGIVGTLHLGLFTKAIFGTPVLTVPPNLAQVPWMSPAEGSFVVLNPPNRLSNTATKNEFPYQGQSAPLEIRALQSMRVVMTCEDHQVELNIPEIEPQKHRLTEANVLVMVVPNQFQKGIPSQIQISMSIVYMGNRTQSLKQFVLPLPAEIDSEEWKNQFELPEQARERLYPLDTSVKLGVIQGKPILLKVEALESESSAQ